MIELNKDNFNKIVIESLDFCLIDYFSDTCLPCIALMPLMEELEKELLGKVKFYKYNAPLTKRVEMREKIFGLPTISIYRNGEKLDSLLQEGASIENIKSMCKKYIEYN